MVRDPAPRRDGVRRDGRRRPAAVRRSRRPTSRSGRPRRLGRSSSSTDGGTTSARRSPPPAAAPGGAGAAARRTTPTATPAPERGLRRDRRSPARPSRRATDRSRSRSTVSGGTGHRRRRPPAPVRRPVGADLGCGRADPARRGADRPERADRHGLRARRTRATPTSRACRRPSTRPGSDRRGDPRSSTSWGRRSASTCATPDVPADDRRCRLRPPPRRRRPVQHLPPRQRGQPAGPRRARAADASPDVRHVLAVCDQLAATAAAPSMPAGRAATAASIPPATSRAGRSRRPPGGSTTPARATTSSTPAATSSRAARRPRATVARRDPPPGPSRTSVAARPGRPRPGRGHLGHLRARRAHRRPADRPAGRAACAA